MNAGQELDQWVAEKVFGLAKGAQVKPYSTDITAAWEVVEKVKDWNFSLYRDYSFWVCELASLYESPLHLARSQTAAHAICLAALKAEGFDL